MNQPDPSIKAPLQKALEFSLEFLSTLDTEPVDTMLTITEIKDRWNDELTKDGKPALEVLEELHTSALPGLIHNQSGRFFSWVIGGNFPVTLAADWLTSAWDQNTGLYHATPSACMAEDIAGNWLKEVLGLPAQASFAFVTGGQMSNFTCLLAARNALFTRAGWDVERDGMRGAPHIRILAGESKHSTITRALRMLGFGANSMTLIPSDHRGAIDVQGVIRAFDEDPEVPTLLILQAGEIHTGAFDDFETLIPLAHHHHAWVHVDGAFGLWANASEHFRHLTRGVDKADSWCVDGHKWLNVPYDCGYAFVAHPDAHFLSVSQHAEYLEEEDAARDPMNWTPELSRRARGFATWAALRFLGKNGVQQLVDRLCLRAKQIVEGIQEHPQIEVIAFPLINQGLVQFHPAKKSLGDIHADDFTSSVINEINRSGEAFFQPSVFKGKRVMRISVSGWRTTEEDVRRTVSAITQAIEAVNALSAR